MDDAFDPEKYAARMQAMAAAMPSDDGLGGRGGRAHTAGGAGVSGGARGGGVGKGGAGGKGSAAAKGGGGGGMHESDDEFANNVVERGEGARGGGNGDDGDGGDGARGRGGAGGGEAAGGAAAAGAGGGAGTQPGLPSGKGWNKTVKERLRWEAAAGEKAEEMKVLRAKWAAEDTERKAVFHKRNEQRGEKPRNPSA